MNDSRILSDKFTSATLPAVCLQRAMLMDLFSQMANKRVLYVSAPAGYGKTVSTQLWLKNSGYVPIWLSLDEFDNSIEVFYKMFCMGIISVQPENRAAAQILASPAFSAAPVDHAIRLLCEFVPDGRRYAIVLDDMHLITNEEIRKSGLLVQKRLPSSFLVIVLTRNKVREEYISITGKDRCGMITEADLAFSPNEIHNYFGEHGHELSEEQAVSIHSATGGWPIGINAMAVTGQTIADGNENILENFFKTKLWNQYSKTTKEFLLKTSISDDLSPELCEHLTGQANCRETLNDLFKNNALIVKSTDGETYRYHHLLSEFLRGVLESDKTINLTDLYSKAAEWYFARCDYIKASHFFIKNRDQEGITRCMRFVRGSKINNNIEVMLSFIREYVFGKLPEKFIAKNTELTGKCIMACYWGGDTVSFYRYLDMIFKNIPKIEKTDPTYMRVMPYLGALDVRVPLYRFLTGEAGGLSFLDFLWLYKEEKANIMAMTQNFPMMHRSMRDFSDFAIDTDNRVKQVRESVEMFIGPEYYALEDGILAGMYYEKNQLDRALTHGHAALKKSGNNVKVEMKFSIYMILAAIHCASGNMKRAESIVEEAKRLIEYESAQHLLPNLQAYTMTYRLQSGNTALAKEWLDKYFVIEKMDLEFYKIYQHFATVRAYTVLGDTAKAMDYVLRLKQMGIEYDRPLDTAEAGTLQAALEWTLGNKTQAQDTLEAVLTSIQKYDYVRVVANEGAAVMPILRKLALRVKSAKYEGELSPQFLNKVMIAAYEQSKRYVGICAAVESQNKVKLSKQQKLVIELLAKGYKNTEIAQLSKLSINTVKVHCSAAYSKLGVSNAMDAVLKAKDLKIIA